MNPRVASTALVATVAVAACFSTPAGNVVDGWIYPTPATAPAGTTPVALATQALPMRPPSPGVGCHAAPSRAVIRYAPGSDRPVRYDLTVPGGGEDLWSWPVGFTARDNGGRLEIVAPDGTVFARDGDTVGVSGGRAADGRSFEICMLE